MKIYKRKQTYEIRDVIHGLILRTPLEVKIINTPIFQRLRKISQLAMANLVYPGAHHTRFEHSLGTMHIAGEIAERLKEKKYLSGKDIEIIRLAALLHDIGHGPFSHVSEYLLECYYDKAKIDIGNNREKIHELVTFDIIKNNEELGELISDKREKILDILQKKKPKNFKSDIVSGPLDADKLDYLLRDNYHTGVKYGLYDLEKIIESMRVISEGDETYLGIDEEGIYALEQLIIAKYHMSAQIYFHKIRGITDSMIVRGIKLAIKNGLKAVESIYSYDGSKKFIDQYCRYYDSNLIGLIIMKGDKYSQEIFRRLSDRRLFKLLHSRRLSEIEGAKLKDKYANLKEDDKKELEAKISEKLKKPKEHVIINIVDIKNPIGKPQGLSIDDETILVKLKDKPAERIRDISWSIFNFKGPYQNIELHVYAPYNELNKLDEKSKEKEKKKNNDIIEKILYK
ncbi:MAG: HD domain-containing protein [Nitrospinae bacterium]|nr:HD domain-containing protein [Nitrospinota bacterium]